MEKFQLLLNLFDFLGNSDGMTTEEIIEELKQDGIDYEKVKGRLMQTVKECQRKVREREGERGKGMEKYKI